MAQDRQLSKSKYLIPLRTPLIHSLDDERDTRRILIEKELDYSTYLKNVTSVSWSDLKRSKRDRFQEVVGKLFWGIVSIILFFLILILFLWNIYPIFLQSLETTDFFERLFLRLNLAWRVGGGIFIANFFLANSWWTLENAYRLLRIPLPLKRDEKSLLDFYSCPDIPPEINPTIKHFKAYWIYNKTEISPNSNSKKINWIMRIKHYTQRVKKYFLGAPDFDGFEFRYIHSEVNFETFFLAITHSTLYEIFMWLTIILLISLFDYALLSGLIESPPANGLEGLISSILIFLLIVVLFAIIIRVLIYRVFYRGIYRIYTEYYKNRQGIISYCEKTIVEVTNALIAAPDQNNLRLELLNLRMLKNNLDRLPKLPLSRYLKYMGYVAIGLSIVSFFI